MQYLTLTQLTKQREMFHRYPSPVVSSLSFGTYQSMREVAEILDVDMKKYSNLIHLNLQKNKYRISAKD